MNTKNILMIGDIVGAAGRTIFQRHIEELKEEYDIDFVIVNGENSAHGQGITPTIVDFFKQHGVDVITSGNHIWHKKEIYPLYGKQSRSVAACQLSSRSTRCRSNCCHQRAAPIAVVNLPG